MFFIILLLCWQTNNDNNVPALQEREREIEKKLRFKK